ncbi:competence protein ComK [Haploplasma axanthum]|nr:competence protein ComK [Haploplasma axanthum]
MEYIVNNEYGSLVYLRKKQIQIKERSLYVINHICKLKLTSLKSYSTGIKLTLDYKYNIPILLNHYLYLCPLGNMQNYETIWVNYKEISNIRLDNEKMILCFYSGNEISIEKNFSFWKQLENKILKIEKYLEKIK